VPCSPAHGNPARRKSAGARRHARVVARGDGLGGSVRRCEGAARRAVQRRLPASEMAAGPRVTGGTAILIGGRPAVSGNSSAGTQGPIQNKPEQIHGTQTGRRHHRGGSRRPLARSSSSHLPRPPAHRHTQPQSRLSIALHAGFGMSTKKYRLKEDSSAGPCAGE